MIGERREGEPLVRRQRMLERDGAGEHAAIELGQHHVHGEIGGAEAARVLLPRGALGGRHHGLEHRHVRPVERRRPARLAARRERGRGDDHGRIEPAQRVAHEGGRIRILEARHDQRRRREAALRQRGAQRVDRRGVGGEQHRAVEDQRHHRLPRCERRDERVESDRAFLRQISGAARQRARHGRVERGAGMAREPAQQAAQILRPAFAEETQQRRQLIRRQRRGLGEARIVAIFSRQHREGDVALARERREPLDAVTPPVEPAEQAHHDHFCRSRHAVDPQIDRHRMLEIAQVREPHARQGLTLHCPGGGEAGEIAVGEREHCHVARRLAEIDGLDDLVERRRAGGEQMHRSERRRFDH